MQAWWINYFTKCTQRARDEGLTKVPSSTTWYCPICEWEVQENNLESHMDSNRHSRNKDYFRRSKSEPVPIPATWGESRYFVWQPEQLRYFCSLCEKMADDNHVNSAKHLKRIQNPAAYGFATGCCDEVCQFANRGQTLFHPPLAPWIEFSSLPPPPPPPRPSASKPGFALSTQQNCEKPGEPKDSPDSVGTKYELATRHDVHSKQSQAQMPGGPDENWYKYKANELSLIHI